MSYKEVNVEVPVVNDDVEKAIRKFRRKVVDLGILDEVRERMFYRKPSQIRNQRKMRQKRLNKYANGKERQKK